METANQNLTKVSETLTQRLKNALVTNDGIAAREIKHNISCYSILKGEEPILHSLVKSDGYKEVFIMTTALSAKFLASAYPDQVALADEMADLILERNPTWTLPDVVNFYKSILLRQDLEGFKVMGNRLTMQKLGEMMGTYDELIAEAREKVVAEEKGKHAMSMTRESTDTSIKALMGKELEKLQVKKEQQGMKVVKRPPADEKWFNQNPL